MNDSSGPAARVDAIVVTYRSAAALPSCLAALRADSMIGHIIVIDHGTDGSAGVARREGADIVVEDVTNPGFGTGQNRGVSMSQSPFVLLCNPDAIIEPGALTTGVGHLIRDDKLAMVQGVITDPDTGQVDRSAGDELGWMHLWGRALGMRRLLRWRPVAAMVRRSRLADTVERRPLENRPVDTLATTAVLVRRSAFESVGGFDTSYFLYGEDLDLCRRLRSAGWDLLTLSDSWASHRAGSSSSDAESREQVWWGGTLRYAATWWPRNQWLASRAAGVVAALRHSHGRPAQLRSNWSAMVREPSCARGRSIA